MTLNKNFLNIILFTLLFLIVTLRVVGPETNVQPDSYRYIQAGLNLVAQGPSALGMSSIFTTFEIALAATLNDTTKSSLMCLAQTSSQAACDVRIPALHVIYIIEIFIFHVSVWAIARLVFANQAKAWLAVALSLGFKETREYAVSILTEPSYMMASGLFLLLLVYAWQNRQALLPWFWCGIALGVIAQIKPAWNAVLPLSIMFAAVLILWFRIHLSVASRSLVAFVGGALLVATPLLIRNVIQLDFWGLTDPAYLGASLAHRFAFNAMSWNEWMMGWLYYLPDFGDNAANALFGKEAVNKLSWGPQSYYVFGRDVLHAQAVAASSSDGAPSYLLQHNFLNDPLKGVAVTALLFWRGIFVGNLMGLIGLLLAGPMLYIMAPQARRQILVISLPIFAMAGVHALTSVSIHRYNIPLIVPYALVMAHFLYVLGWRIAAQFPVGLRTKANAFFPKNG